MTDLSLGDTSLGLDSSSPYNDQSAVATDGSSSSAWSFDNLIGLGNKAVDLYGKIRSVTGPGAGSAAVAQPVTIPAPNSPIGRDAMPAPTPSTSPTWWQRQASRFGVGLGTIYTVVILGFVLVALVVYRLFKGR